MTLGQNKRKLSTRRRRGFHQVAGHMRTLVEQNGASYGFAEPDVLIRWPEIVGEQLAGQCQPIHVKYSSGPAFGAVLLVQTDGGHAPEIEHLTPRILERINSFYGYRAVSRIKITQATGIAGQSTGFAEETAAFTHAPADNTMRRPPLAAPQPDPAVHARAARMTRDIQDPDLRAALTLMGAYVLTQPPSNPTTNCERDLDEDAD